MAAAASIRIALVCWVAIIAVGFTGQTADAGKPTEEGGPKCMCTVPPKSKRKSLLEHKLGGEHILLNLVFNSSDSRADFMKHYGGLRWKHWDHKQYHGHFLLDLFKESKHSRSRSHHHRSHHTSSSSHHTSSGSHNSSSSSDHTSFSSDHTSSSSHNSSFSSYQKWNHRVNMDYKYQEALIHAIGELLVTRPQKATKCSRLLHLLCADDKSCLTAGLDPRMLQEIISLIMMPSSLVCQ